METTPALTLTVTRMPTSCDAPGCTAPAIWMAVAGGTGTAVYACSGHLGFALERGPEYVVIDIATIDAQIGPMPPFRLKELVGLAQPRVNPFVHAVLRASTT